MRSQMREMRRQMSGKRSQGNAYRISDRSPSDVFCLEAERSDLSLHKDPNYSNVYTLALKPYSCV